MAAGKLFILYLDEKLDKEVFGVTDHESAIGFWKFKKSKIADPIWWPEYFLFYFPMKYWLKGFVEALIENLLSDFEN